MRIVFVIPYFYDAWAYGGQPRSAYEMAKSLVERGHAVEVLTTDSGGPHRLSVGGDGETRVVHGITIRHYRNLSNALAYRYRVFLPLKLFKEVAQRIRAADVVHIHELRSLLSVAAAFASVRQSIPFVLSPHGGLRHLGRGRLKTIFDNLWGHRILKAAAGVLAISPIEEQDALAMRVPAEKIFRVPNSVDGLSADSVARDNDFRQRRGLGTGRLVVFLGRLHRVKGADLLLEAFARVCHDEEGGGVHLVLAGPDDGEGARLHEIVGRLNLHDRVTFTGYLDQKEKFEALSNSHLVVVPSRSEVFAITAVEALICSRPVLLSSACGLDPLPGDDQGLRTFRSESIDDLAAQLRQALNDPVLFDSARRGRDFVLREFSADAQAVRLESLYRRVVASNG
jgi:glycosyltransferase involved in cell wall biosynthesis